MASTASQVNPLNTVRMAVGAYLEDDTAVAVTITLGFTPRYVHVWNETSGDEEEWNEKMADAEAFKRVAAGTGALITSNGITPGTGTFIIGLDTDINVVNEQMSWIALG